MDGIDQDGVRRDGFDYDASAFRDVARLALPGATAMRLPQRAANGDQRPSKVAR